MCFFSRKTLIIIWPYLIHYWNLGLFKLQINIGHTYSTWPLFLYNFTAINESGLEGCYFQINMYWLVYKISIDINYECFILRLAWVAWCMFKFRSGRNVEPGKYFHALHVFAYSLDDESFLNFLWCITRIAISICIPRNAIT
jgi:hypothetical protein